MDKDFKEMFEGYEMADTTAHFIDTIIELADKYHRDRKRALWIAIISLMSAEEHIDFDRYEPKGE